MTAARRVLFSAWPRFDASEIRFWHDLRDALHQHNLSLVLATSGQVPCELDVQHVAHTTTIDAFWPITEGVLAGLPVDALGLDANALLERESAWSGPAIVPAIERSRRAAIEAVAAERVRWLQTLAPVATVIWNGQHVDELILAAASRQGGTPVLHVERAPIPEALFADEEGLSSASHVVSVQPWPTPEPRWTVLASAVLRQVKRTRATWWEQPAARWSDAQSLRAILDIPAHARVVLFAGQVDQDTQSFLFSPQHGTNLEAFRWLLNALASYPDVYVLGKQHPKSGIPAVRYEECLAHSTLRGRWRSDVSIDDALAVADRVAAVNSTVLYEALARQRPVLALGDWLLSGQGVAYEPSADPKAIEHWLDASDAAARQERGHHALGHLLKHSIYGFDATSAGDGLRGAGDLAQRIAGLAATAPWQAPEELTRQLMRAMGAGLPNWSPADPTWTDRRDAMADRLSEWHCGQSLRHALLPAVNAHRQGRRVFIWGVGRAAHAVHAMLSEAGVPIHGLISDHTEHTVPHAALAPEAVQRTPVPDFVVVATSNHQYALAQLEGLGLFRGCDSTVVDCDMLLSMPVHGSVPKSTAYNARSWRAAP